MGLKIDSEKMQTSINKMQESLTGIDYILDKLKECNFPSDKTYKVKFITKKSAIILKLNILINLIKNTKTEIQSIKTAVENAEQKNISVASGFIVGSSVNGLTGNVNGNSNNVITPSANISEGLEEKDTPTKDAIDAEINNEEQNIELEENIPGTQVEAVIELIYGEDTDIPDDTRERIVEVIANINKAEILKGLDEDIANQIRAEIIRDYLEEKLELEGIKTEDLQEYIDSQPSIKIQFEIDEALANFDSLIESGVLTKDQIKSIIKENIEIHDDQEFNKLYIENGGTETEVSNIDSFYDPETQKVHIRDTVESETITVSIVTALDDVLFYNEETGEISYNQVNGLDQDSNINIENSDINSSVTNVEDIETNATIEMSGETINSTVTDDGDASTKADNNIHVSDDSEK